jgi:hypothetical protein
MPDKQKKPSVILKRQVTTKAVVTPSFKEFLFYELQENMKHFRKQLDDAKAQLNSLSPSDPRVNELNKLMMEAKSYIDAETDQRKFITNLELKSLYSQGPVEGFVTVSVGDNVYEKLGAVELVIEDGIVKKIQATSSQYDKVTKTKKV